MKAAGIREQVSAGSERVEGLLYALAAVAVEMWFVWQFRDFLVDCLRLWLGR